MVGGQESTTKQCYGQIPCVSTLYNTATKLAMVWQSSSTKLIKLPSMYFPDIVHFDEIASNQLPKYA